MVPIIALIIVTATSAHAQIKSVGVDMIGCEDWTDVSVIQKLHNAAPLSKIHMDAVGCQVIKSGSKVILTEDGVSADKVADVATGKVLWIRSGLLDR